MPFTDLMMKLADGEKLTPGEREELRLLSQDLDRNRIETGAWIGEGGRATLKNPAISDPDFRSSPTHVFHAYFTTSDTIANDTAEKITFESSGGDDSVFGFLDDDKSKIKIDRSQYSMRMDGIVAWDANSTGFRFCQLRVYDRSGNSLGTQTLHRIPAATGVITIIPLCYTENIRGIFPEAHYMEFWVQQNSGGDLDLTNFVLAVSIA